MTNKRANFSSAVKKQIAIMAGHKCTYPSCRTETSNASRNAGTTTNSGIAAHIYSAAGNGPRGTGNKSELQRMQSENGIWVCKIHSNMIDEHKGSAYPAEELKRWKECHEAWSQKNSGGLPISSAGWLEKIEIPVSPIFDRAAVIEFGKSTFIFGGLGLGKTMILDLLAAPCGHPRSLARWSDARTDFEYRIKYASPAPEELICTMNHGTLGYKLSNGRSINQIAGNLRSFYRDESWYQKGRYDDLDELANLLDESRNLIKSVFSKVRGLNFPKIVDVKSEVLKKARSDYEGPSLAYRPEQVLVRLEHQDDFFPLGALSGGERRVFLLVILTVLAEVEAASTPTTLLIELASTQLDKADLHWFINRFSSSQFRPQVVVASHTPLADEEIKGWSVAELQANSGKTRISQRRVTL